QVIGCAPVGGSRSVRLVRRGRGTRLEVFILAKGLGNEPRPDRLAVGAEKEAPLCLSGKKRLTISPEYQRVHHGAKDQGQTGQPEVGTNVGKHGFAFSPHGATRPG